jgi:hypothetical protein
MASYTLSKSDAKAYDGGDCAQWQSRKRELMSRLPSGVEVYHPEGFVIFVTD